MKLVKEKVTIERIDHEATGALARQHRRAMLYSLQEVAGRMGVSTSYLSSLERGARPWTDDLMKKFNEAMGFKR